MRCDISLKIKLNLDKFLNARLDIFNRNLYKSIYIKIPIFNYLHTMTC